MDDLRSEIRAAFEKEQAGHAPPVNLRHEVVRDATRQPRREKNLQWVAVAATIVIGVLVVASLMSTRLGQRVIPSATPGASPAASPTGDYGTPPTGVQLIYVADPNHAGWYIGFDWTGKPRGTVKMSDRSAGVLMAPDGQSFAVGLIAKGGNWQFLDRLGRPLGSSQVPGAFGTMWADDNRHACTITEDVQTFEWALWTDLPGEPVKRVGVVAKDQSLGQSGLSLAACSFRNDRAIVVRTTIAAPTQYLVIRLSDGKVMSIRNYDAGSLASVVASADSKYVAENSASIIQPSQGAAPATVVRNVDDWSVVATLTATNEVLSFSGDDSEVLVRTFNEVNYGPAHLAIFALSPLKTLWQYNGPEQLDVYAAQPDGDAFAFSLQPTGSPAGCGPACTDPRDILIVGADGTETRLPGHYAPTWNGR